MKAIERVIGITISAMFLSAGPSLAQTAAPAVPVTPTNAHAVAVQRVPGTILATRLETDAGRAVYNVEIRTADNDIRQVQVDARDATVVGVHDVTDPGVTREIEAP